MKILIVDDEVLITKSLERVFRSAGHEVKTAADGLAGLAEWQTFYPDLVLLDVLMPGMTGPQLILEMNGRHNAKVILMSAYSGEAIANMDSKFDLFLSKPFDDIFKIVKIAEDVVKKGT